MFSFFKSKKPSPTQIPSDPIPGAVPPAPREDDFIFIERRGQQPAEDGSTNGTGSAAVAGAAGPGGGIYPTVPEPPAGSGSEQAGYPVPVRQRSDEKTGHALHGVPFRLSADIGQPADMEITRIQANEILTYINRVMYAPDYDFSLERSVLQD